MAQDHSAVLLGAADSQIASGQGAHDMLHDNSQGREASRQATEAMKTSGGFNLESSTIDGTPAVVDDLEVHPTHLQDSSHDIIATGHHVEPCVTTAHDGTKGLVRVNGKGEPNQVAPSSASIIPPSQLPRDATPHATPPSPTATKTTIKSSGPSAASHTTPENASSNNIPSQRTSHDGGAGAHKPHEGNMLFSNRANVASNASHRRRQYANTSALTDYEADLTGKDRAKQKEAVRKLLMEKVKDDWKWDWPRPKPQLDPHPKPEIEREVEPEESKDEPEPAPVSPPVQPVDTHESQGEPADEVLEEQWKERDEWISNASDSGEDAALSAARRAERQRSGTNEDPFRFETPDHLGETIKKTQSERKRRRKKRLAEEMTWNDGVRCFIERRDAWTGARRVIRSPTTKSRRPLVEQLRRSTSHSSQDGGSSTAIEPEASDAEEDWEADVEIPVARPLIPPENAMRASITPTAYNTIYDKVILQNLSPSCPINLKDITRSCVQGWKRDGEWPPKSSVPDTLEGRRRRKSLASLFGLEKTKSKEDKEKAEKEKAEKEAHKSSDDHKPGAFKKFTRKLLLLGKDKDHEHSKEHGKEHGNVSNGSNGKAKEAVAGA